MTIEDTDAMIDAIFSVLADKAKAQFRKIQSEHPEMTEHEAFTATGKWIGESLWKEAK